MKMPFLWIKPEPLIVVQRFFSNQEETLGHFNLYKKHLCFTLEDQFQVKKVYAETRIPAGLYPLILEDSPKFTPRYGHLMLTVAEVPEFTGIRIHKGIKDTHTAGCLLVGTYPVIHPGTKRATLAYSQEAYDAMYYLVSPIVKTQKSWIRIIDND